MRADIEAVLALLEERHGVGVRAALCPGWIEARLIRALDGLPTPSGSFRDALEREPKLLARIADELRVGRTSFYRDPPQWHALRETVLPPLGTRPRVRALSVGCSTGEEAWTLAMCCASASLPCPISVVGMDRSRAAIAVAAVGEYAEELTESVPKDLARRFLEPSRDGVRAMAAELRPVVRFVEKDLVAGPPPGAYEIIVCKNVLIYFGDEAGDRAVERLFGALAPGGVLVVARSEVPRVRALGRRAIEIGPGVVAFAP